MGSTVSSADIVLGFDNEAVLVLLRQLPRGADDLVDQRRQIDGLRVESSLPASIFERSST